MMTFNLIVVELDYSIFFCSYFPFFFLQLLSICKNNFFMYVKAIKHKKQNFLRNFLVSKCFHISKLFLKGALNINVNIFPLWSIWKLIKRTFAWNEFKPACSQGTKLVKVRIRIFNIFLTYRSKEI